MDGKTLFSSSKDDWATPQWLFDQLDKEFCFDLDPCAIEANAKCDRFYTPEIDGLMCPWYSRAFCNPPYSNYAEWVRKAKAEVVSGRCNVAVLLLAARTDTKIFHELIYPAGPDKAQEIRFLKGRITFEGAKSGAPFPSMIVVYHGGVNGSYKPK